MKIDKEVTIIESKQVNERRQKERAAAGLGNDLKPLVDNTQMKPHMVGDPRYYELMLEGNKYTDWQDL